MKAFATLAVEDSGSDDTHVFAYMMLPHTPK